jgi:hypothetical protein
LSRVHDEVTASDIEVIGQPDDDRLRGMRQRNLALERVDADDRRARTRRHDDDDIVDLDDTRRELPRIAAVVS